VTNVPAMHPRHLRAARMCMSGARAWFKAHDLDWAAMVKNGLPLKDIEHIKCPLLDKVRVEIHKEYGDGR
jgi:hypothetical protein